MSGGAFDYKQHNIRDIRETIQEEINQQGKEKIIEGYFDKDYYIKYPSEKFGYVYREDVQTIFKEAIEVLKKAEVYAQRIDWYLSGDDGEDSLISRLKDELSKL